MRRVARKTRAAIRRLPPYQEAVQTLLATAEKSD
jgi:hypothetical protein